MKKAVLLGFLVLLSLAPVRGEDRPLPEGALARMGPGERAGMGAMNAVAFSPDGKLLASGDRENLVTLWEAATGRKVRELRGHTNWIRCLGFSPDGATLASGGTDGTLRLWETATGRELRRFQGHEGEIHALCFFADGKTLASGGQDMTVRLWEVATGRELRRLQGHENRVHGLAVSPDGVTLASGSIDKTLRVWDAASGRALLKLKGHDGDVASVAFSPDGKTVATASDDGTLRLWAAATGRELMKLEGHDGRVLSVAFSPDGGILASAGYDHTVRLWEPATGKELVKLDGHEGPVLSVAFSPDGRRLASGGCDVTCLVWDLGALPGSRETPPALEALWIRLASGDAREAFLAAQALAGGGGRAAAFLGERLVPVDTADPRLLAGLVAGLDDPSFAAREKASDALEALDHQAEAPLRKALSESPSMEVQARGQRLLDGLALPLVKSPEALRGVRAVRVLELLGGPEARAALVRLSKGAPAARLTRRATEALKRLEVSGR